MNATKDQDKRRELINWFSSSYHLAGRLFGASSTSRPATGHRFDTNTPREGLMDMSTSGLVLTLFISWTLFLLVLMEVVRSYRVVTGRSRSNEFKPDNSNLSPFMQRLARAHANCVESFPVLGGLLVVALATGRSEITDPLAPWLLIARVVQSSIHLVSLSVIAVNARFASFAVQVAIAAYWVWALLSR
jgi:uncharacterized MAPEG superfamily protein